ncbi:hypothetical protein FB45DRAFT_1050956 [Roridomyces roridus]|uniref:Uncharacterized protein n=1 Tax=Roridomyces roridus TaxID=1738132 RepID=A0AAD7CL07_9AGAR|nr:hypothetical protein FB45DRAFT_1050956 [Roridomyces roridus]
MRDFAPETIDAVLDEVGSLVEDSPQLSSIATCGLVCRQWTPCSRVHVFRRLVLNGSNIGRFFQLVESSVLPLLELAREVELQFNDGAPFERRYIGRLQQLVNLTALKIEVTVTGRQQDYTEDVVAFNSFLETYLPTIGRSIKHFELCWVAHDMAVRAPWGMFPHLFECLPAIEVFKMSSSRPGTMPVYILPDEDNNAETHSHSHPTHLHTLHLSKPISSRPFLDWLLSCRVLPVLKSLDFCTFNPNEWDRLKAYCERAGKELRFLSLAFNSGDFGLLPGVLQHTTMLTELLLKSCNTADYLPGILSTITSHDLRVIHVSLWTAPTGREQEEFDSSFPYALVETVLARPQFRGLRRFRAEYDGVSVLRAAEAQRLMPLAYARGILECRS